MNWEIWGVGKFGEFRELASLGNWWFFTVTLHFEDKRSKREAWVSLEGVEGEEVEEGGFG